tara:strand:+ start:379 stop:486 length:108 start_codon:yes stop_codon:yes gene_type:complete
MKVKFEVWWCKSLRNLYLKKGKKKGWERRMERLFF